MVMRFEGLAGLKGTDIRDLRLQILQVAWDRTFYARDDPAPLWADRAHQGRRYNIDLPDAYGSSQEIISGTADALEVSEDEIRSIIHRPTNVVAIRSENQRQTFDLMTPDGYSPCKTASRHVSQKGGGGLGGRVFATALEIDIDIDEHSAVCMDVAILSISWQAARDRNYRVPGAERSPPCWQDGRCDFELDWDHRREIDRNVPIDWRWP